MTLLYYHPDFLQHQTGKHPERPARLEQVWRQLQRTGLDQRCKSPAWQPASREQMLRVHEALYLDRLQAYAAAGGGRIEADTVVSPWTKRGPKSHSG